MITFSKVYSDFSGDFDVWCIKVGVLRVKFKLTPAQVNGLMRALVTGQEFSVKAQSVNGGIVPVHRGNTSGTGKRMMVEVDHKFLGCEAEETVGIMHAAVVNDGIKAETPGGSNV